MDLIAELRNTWGNLSVNNCRDLIKLVYVHIVANAPVIDSHPALLVEIGAITAGSANCQLFTALVSELLKEYACDT